MESANHSIIFSVLLALLLCFGVYADNKVCYECWHMSHPRDCSNIVECGSNQVCFVERYVTSDAHVYYNSGCLSNQSCHSHYPILGRRESENTAITKPDVTDLKRYNPSQYPDCSSCCQSDYCNTNLCETHQVNSTKKRCLSCDSVEHPSECHKVIGCDVDEMCYTTYYLHTFGEKRYRLGCMRKHVCDQSGMTNPVETHYCSECCTGDNCNRDLCKNVASVTSATSPVPTAKTVTSITTTSSSCQDSLIQPCAKEILPIVCNDEIMKFYCKKSCQICGMTPLPESACFDTNPAECNNQTMLQTICANEELANLLCRKSCGICHVNTANSACIDVDYRCFNITFLAGACSDPARMNLCKKSCFICS
ncbi:uncharacterized protein LOC132544848 [Ylistrum balloti]|uniref:uncharacterized protein LOC132544848 n=1 Tax=Ylistrum balloti TaxID=509963 RepID=UPI002905EABC|nr:uncharacterized protein LOC132544848 [Ylistrum balloti]